MLLLLTGDELLGFHGTGDLGGGHGVHARVLGDLALAGRLPMTAEPPCAGWHDELRRPGRQDRFAGGLRRRAPPGGKPPRLPDLARALYQSLPSLMAARSRYVEVKAPNFTQVPGAGHFIALERSCVPLSRISSATAPTRQRTGNSVGDCGGGPLVATRQMRPVSEAAPVGDRIRVGAAA